MKKIIFSSLSILLLVSACKPIGTLVSDVTAPSGSMSINAGAAYTTSTSVTLTFDSSDSTEMYVTNASGCESGGTWEAYASTKPWTLEQTNATANVYVKFKDRSQNMSSCFSDSIVHDNVVPIVSGASLNPESSNTGTVASFYLSKAGTVTLYDGSDCSAAISVPTAKTAGTQTLATNTFPATSGNVGPHSIYAKVLDDAGNSSACTPIGNFHFYFWYQEAYLKAPNSDVGDIFGTNHSISGNTMVVGALGESSNQTFITNGTTASDDDSSVSSGAAYVFKRTGSTWAQEAYLKAPNNDANDGFGASTAISGDTIVVGAFGESSNQTTITNGTTASDNDSSVSSGAAYVFKRMASTWAQEAYLKAPNNDANDGFGASTAISGDTIVVGAAAEDSNQTTITNGTTASDDDSSPSSGAAYVFKRTGSTWAQEAYLKAPNGENDDFFGSFVGSGTDNLNNLSVSGDTLVVGANGEDSNQTTITNGTTASGDNTNTESGAAYVFKRTGIAWAPEAYLKAPNNDANDGFGASTAISGDTIVVGAASEDSNQTTITNGTTASGDNTNTESGAAYVFKRTGSTWAQEAYLKAPNNDFGESFGASTAISGDTIVVGAFGESSNQTTITNGTTASGDNTNTESGAAYVFKRTGSTWAQEAYLKAPNNDANDGFGASTAISGDTIVVGAAEEDSNQTTITNGTTASENDLSQDSGSAYVFRRHEVPQAPTVASVTPTSGTAEGNNVIIFGSGFMKDASVSIGGASCATVTVQGPNEIICNLPTKPASGPLSIVVTNPSSAGSSTLASAYTYP